MKSFVVIALFSLLLSSCADDMTQYQLNPPADIDLPADTSSIPTIDITEDDSSSSEAPASSTEQIFITIDGAGINVSAPNFDAERSDDVSNLQVKIDEQGNIEYLQVNKIILYQEKSDYKINHNYTYIEDDWIEIQSGNVLDAIIADHRALGYNVTRESVKRCNPFLNKRSLQIGDRIRLSCDTPKAKRRNP